MIHSSKQVLLVSASEGKQFFMFDPKTTAVLHKYREECPLLGSKLYCPLSQQVVGQQSGRTFLSVWSWDAHEAEMKISMTETLSALALSADGHFLMGGSATGNLYIWELPSGLLLKKKSLHGSPITRILAYRQNHVVTVSRTEVKVWALSGVLVEEDNSPPLKQYTSLLDILEVAETRGIIAILSHKNLALLLGSLGGPRELGVLRKVDFEFATAMAISNTSAFVGDGKGNIEVVELLEEEGGELRFRERGEALELVRGKKRRVLSSSKSPVSCLAFVQSLAYLVSGHVSGEVTIWSNFEVKKSLHLFKSAIASLSVLAKPHEHKITQSAKIRPLHKYEQSKEQELLEVIVDSVEGKGEGWGESGRHEEEEILERMLTSLKQPEKLLREEIEVLRGERGKLIQANLHYFKLLAP